MKVKQTGKAPERIDWNNVTSEIKQEFRTNVLGKLSDLKGGDVDGNYQKICATLHESSQLLPKKKPGKHKNWMTDEIIHLLDERRKYKISGDANAYSRTDRLIKAKCNEAKEQFLNRKCEEMEDFYQLSPREAHQKIREVTGKYRIGGSKFSSIKSKTG